MKKLILYNHLGEKVLELETFVEGQDFTWESLAPTPYWLGKILLVDKEPEPEEKAEAALEKEVEPKVEVSQAILPDEALAAKMKCDECGWTGKLGECIYGHNAYTCPQCGSEALKEVTDEPKTTGDKSSGKRRTSKADSSKDSKKLPKKPARGKDSKGSK